MPTIKELAGQLEGQFQSIIKTGVAPMPEEKFTFKPSKTARSVSELTAHLAYSNYFFMGVMKGEPGTTEGWDEAQAAWEKQNPCDTKANATKAYQKSVADFLAYFKTLKDADLMKPAKLPWRETNIAGVIMDNQWHLTYHLGQMAYIQTVIGDTVDHM